MSEDLKYPQLTPVQVELWLTSPVTKYYLLSLGWAAEQMVELIGSGRLVDSSNSDLTFAKIHSALGEKNGLLRSADPERLLNDYKLIGEGNDTDI